MKMLWMRRHLAVCVVGKGDKTEGEHHSSCRQKTFRNVALKIAICDKPPSMVQLQFPPPAPHVLATSIRVLRAHLTIAYSGEPYVGAHCERFVWITFRFQRTPANSCSSIVDIFVCVPASTHQHPALSPLASKISALMTDRARTGHCDCTTPCASQSSARHFKRGVSRVFHPARKLGARHCPSLYLPRKSERTWRRIGGRHA